MSEKKSILLVNPPLSKPCEPPAGLAKLAGVLKSAQIDCRVLDANLEGIFYLLGRPVKAGDTWSRRAFGNLETNLRALRSKDICSNKDRYKRMVLDINRVLHMAGREAGVNISLSNYSSPVLSPVRSNDLLQAAERFEENPFFPCFQKKLREYYSVQEPDLTGISINFMSQALCALAMAGFIKKRFPKTRIVFGGGLITSWMNIPGFSNPFTGLVDDLVSGPGENALLSMCGANATAASSLTGFDYTQFTMADYLSPGPVLPYSTSRGCYWQRCAFCPEKSEGSGYRPSDLRAVTDDISHLTTEKDPYLIHFMDNALSPRFLRHLTQNPPGFPWYGFVRITPHLADSDFVKGLKASGCVMLKLGLESGDQAVLDALNKGIHLQTVSAALRTLKKASIATYAYLLFGTPAETLASARKTLDFTVAHAHSIDFLNLAVFNLPAYSEAAKKLDTVEFYQGDLSLYREFMHPKGWNRDRVKRFLAKEFKKQPTIRPILHNAPPFFTSNHAPFLVMASQSGTDR